MPTNGIYWLNQLLICKLNNNYYIIYDIYELYIIELNTIYFYIYIKYMYIIYTIYIYIYIYNNVYV